MHPFFRLFYFILAMLCLSSLAMASLSPIEVKIKNYLQKESTKELNFLAKLVEINSGTENIKGVKRVGRLLEKRFKALGFKTSWHEEPAFMHKAPTFIATHEGKKGKRLLLIGHLDTVFGPDDTFQHFKKEGAYASGPGVTDNKGGDVVILYALKALSHFKLLEDRSITVVLTGDEEESGKPASISRKPLIQAADNKEVALDFEPAVDLHLASTGRRGISNWALTTQGRQGHSSTIFKKYTGAGAIFEVSHILDEIRRELSAEKNLSFNPSLILGGTEVKYRPKKSSGRASGKHNIVAKEAIAQGDLRYLSVQQKETAKGKIQAIVKRHLAETSAKISFVDGIPPMEPTPRNQKLLENYSQVSLDSGFGPVKAFDPGLKGAGDISYIAAKVPANLVGLGPVGSGQHSVNERLEIKSLEINTIRAALLIYRLTHEERN